MRIIKVLLVGIMFNIFVLSQSISEKQREFDFWIGEWDVNLRVHQKDFTWKDNHKSIARIYSILDGKALLELWSESEKGINGYSLRYYNPKKGTWDLWLNWANNNRSATSGMECTFRHKRAECFSKRKINEATNLISRYTFSDAQPNSVRWDDAYSRDEGKTWSNNWIMEFSRKSKTAPPIDSTSKLLTYFNGNRCNTPQFSILKQLVKKHQNNSSLKLYNVLDGCMLVGFVKTRKISSYFTLTYNVFAKAYELTYLDSRDSTALAMYYGNKTADGFELQTVGTKNKKPATASIKVSQIIKSIDLKYEGKNIKLRF